MTTLIDVQFIAGKDGRPEYAVVPFKVFQTLCNHKTKQRENDITIPHEVVEKIILNETSPIQAWREYLNLTQTELAEKIGITQAAYSQIEKAKKNRKATLQKIAEAMNIDYLQLKI
ncbi:helix-turn-helix domain-containing protein [Treponema putidum]|uniref:helix-turn-helix domain-containing protein n=1 Tax=Treponema putidum TaxID=221027 RepID=UPI003D94F333